MVMIDSEEFLQDEDRRSNKKTDSETKVKKDKIPKSKKEKIEKTKIEKVLKTKKEKIPKVKKEKIPKAKKEKIPKSKKEKIPKSNKEKIERIEKVPKDKKIKKSKERKERVVLESYKTRTKNLFLKNIDENENYLSFYKEIVETPVKNTEIKNYLEAEAIDYKRYCYFLGNKIDISKRFKNDTMIITNTRSYINCMDSINDLIFVGMKDNNEPLNLFDFKTGKSEVRIYNKDLILIDTLLFEHGIVIDIKVRMNADIYNCIVLYHDGSLAMFDYLLNVPIQDISNKFTNFKIFETEMKVIRFALFDDVIAFTDGFVVVVDKHGERTISGKFNEVISDVELLYGDSGNKIACVSTTNGHYFYLDLSLTKLTELGNCFGYSRLHRIENLNILLATDGIQVRWCWNFKISDKKLRLMRRFIYSLKNGIISMGRGVAKKIRSKNILQIVYKNENTFICTHNDEFEYFKNTTLFLPNLKYFNDEFSEYIITATEDGLLFKFYMDII